MRARFVAVVVGREYLTRVRHWGFWVSTLLLPVLLATLFVLPALLVTTSPIEHSLLVVDETGRVADPLRERIEGRTRIQGRAAKIRILPEEPGPDPSSTRAALDRRVLEGQADAWIWIDDDVLSSGVVPYHGTSVSNFLTQDMLEDELTVIFRRVRLTEAGLDPARVAELTRGVSFATSKITKEGTREEKGFKGLALAGGVFFLLYFMLIFYGQMVMNGVLEEKTSRVVEVVISTLRPSELMMGKLLGIGAVGLTQIAIWLLSTSLITAPGLVRRLGADPGTMSLPDLSWGLAVHTVLFFALGFFLFASFYAAIGAAFNDVSEAQMFAGAVAMLLVVPMLLFWPVQDDPDSTLAVATSLVPLFSPLLMLLRIIVKTPPWWQIAIAYLLSAASVYAMVWVAGRIYRVGILMHGKKPTPADLYRWIRS